MLSSPKAGNYLHIFIQNNSQIAAYPKFKYAFTTAIMTGGKNGNANPGGHANLQFYLARKIIGSFLWKNHG